MLDGNGGYYLKGFGSAQFLSSYERSPEAQKLGHRSLNGSFTNNGIRADATGLAKTVSEALTGRADGYRSASTVEALVKQLSLELRCGLPNALGRPCPTPVGAVG